jgi:predicted secreted hydrolase
MRSSVALVIALAASALGSDEPYRKALPGYTYQFPRDYFNHPEFRTEWWYYTGNLRSADGRRFGYELTFFRHAATREPAKNVWDIGDVWMAHFALTDVQGAKFHHAERLNRTGPGLAGVDAGRGRVWNGNWFVDWQLDSNTPAAFRSKHLVAMAPGFAVDLTMTSEKPAVTHGLNGVSQKSAGAGRASHYVSLTRLKTRGTLRVNGQDFAVEGQSWMDHEFFSHSLESNQSGWDWFSLQLDDGTELMLYRLRRKDGTVEPYSSGTYIERDGKTRHLRLSDFQLKPGRTWSSAETKASYPVEWTVDVPPLGIHLSLTTPLAGQELVGKSRTSPVYWEGAVDVAGTRNGTALKGRGYLEMAGYAGAVRMGE